ncbi:hypothetical protein Taro_019861 [Colocasia esculenta]|uniref:Uncharacterized protein n=1 Tax=Colocasia esculenta TaxID=4460 RepID=A0A843UXZ9_COLES|nr:hypothetical protein [Colocasia esculenta]
MVAALGKATPRSVAIRSRRDDTSRSQPLGVFKKPQPDRTTVSSARPREGELRRFLVEIRVFSVLVLWEARVEREKRRGSVVSRGIACSSRGRVTPPIFGARIAWNAGFDQFNTYYTIDIMPRNSLKHEKHQLRVVCMVWIGNPWRGSRIKVPVC